MKIYHLGVMVDWEYDEDFVRLIEEKARASGLETLVVWPAWVEELSQELIEGRLNFKFIVDRASLSSPEFIKLILLAQEQGTTIFDPPDKVLRSADKATMHLEFISQGILTPYTIILPPFEQAPSLDSFEIDLSPVGQPFVIKPANMSGGGLGVNKDGFTLEDIQRTRQEFPQDKYLIQERIEPKIINGQRFWFRIFYSWGLIQACWWNDETHVYKELIEQEITDY